MLNSSHDASSFASSSESLTSSPISLLKRRMTCLCNFRMYARSGISLKNRFFSSRASVPVGSMSSALQMYPLVRCQLDGAEQSAKCTDWTVATFIPPSRAMASLDIPAPNLSSALISLGRGPPSIPGCGVKDVSAGMVLTVDSPTSAQKSRRSS